MAKLNALIFAFGLFTTLQSLAQSSASTASTASDFPTKSVTFVVPFPPAGGADTLARILASHLSTVWKQQVIVENRPGAFGNIGLSLAARAAPDGYTLYMAAVTNLSIAAAASNN